MSCACGHHHDHIPVLIPGGKEIALAAPLITVQGRLICRDMGQMMVALDLLPEHVAASREEPGNLRFDLRQSDNPLVWHVEELFANIDAMEAHRLRAANSRWGGDGSDLIRELTQSEIRPRIRNEAGHDHHAIHDLLCRAFGSDAEAALVANLRDTKDLTLSLVADANGVILGHVALSSIMADRPALALAPVAVDPRIQNCGIGSALIRAAMEQFSDHLIVVLGDPVYYSRFGFRPVEWDSPFAGPSLLAAGPDLPAGLRIAHAAAFGPLNPA